MGNGKILLVESEEILLEVVKLSLESKGYKALTAKDGEEAIDVYKQHKDEIAVVFSDMWLSKLEGWQVFETLKQINPHVKMIFTGGYFSEKIKSEMLKAGAIDYIQKPYTADDIAKKIKEVTKK